MEDPVEVQLPGSDCFLVILRMHKPRDCVPSTPLDDLPLDSCHSSAIKTTVSKLSKLCITCLAHVVNWFIASLTDWLRSFSFFPFIPRSRALQISAQTNPSSTYSCSLTIESWMRVNPRSTIDPRDNALVPPSSLSFLRILNLPS